MSNREVRALLYMVMLILVAIDRTTIGGALFLALMDFLMARSARLDEKRPLGRDTL